MRAFQTEVRVEEEWLKRAKVGGGKSKPHCSFSIDFSSKFISGFEISQNTHTQTNNLIEGCFCILFFSFISLFFGSSIYSLRKVFVSCVRESKRQGGGKEKLKKKKKNTKTTKLNMDKKCKLLFSGDFFSRKIDIHPFDVCRAQSIDIEQMVFVPLLYARIQNAWCKTVVICFFSPFFRYVNLIFFFFFLFFCSVLKE